MARKRAGRGSTPRAVGRVAGRARTGPAIGRVRPIELAHTEVTHIEEPPPPIFADPSGIRRRHLRRLLYTAVGLVVALLLAFWLSQLSGDTPVTMAPARGGPGMFEGLLR